MIRNLPGRTPLRRFLILLVALVTSTFTVSLVASSPASAAVNTKTTVSLTFDDSTSDQLVVPAMLTNHGMKGTFYIISGRLGTSGYMTASQVQQLQQQGEDIGGHTVTHPDLPTLSASQQQSEICGGRIALQNLGLTVNTLAYPFGDYTATTEQIAKTCGFSGARTIGGVDCSGCDKAETIPPADKFAVQTPDSIKSGDRLATIESYVTKAEKSGGGWVALTFHHVCNGCDTYSIKQATLNSFLTWLQPRSATGTVVKTMSQVLGAGSGSTPPPPPPPPPPTTLQNPSLEADTNSDGVPDCWQLGGFGTNTPVWTRTSDAHSGSFAEKLQLTSLTDGDAKLVTQQHDPSCEPAANVGHTDTFSAWYKSTQPVYLVAYYLDSSGVWNFWEQSDPQAASTSYKQASWTTPAVPAGATNLSFGLSLRQVGTVTMDDFALVQN